MSEMTHAQRSKCVLHWLINGILELSRMIATSIFDEKIAPSTRDRKVQSRPLYLEEKI